MNINVISGTENMRFYRLDKAKLSGDMKKLKITTKNYRLYYLIKVIFLLT